MNTVSVDAHTPGLGVIDPRGLGVRAVAYCRAGEDESAQVRITRQVFDTLGRDVAHFDPRFSVNGQIPNLTSIHGLSAVERLTSRADAGWVVALMGEAGQLVQRWDSRSSQQSTYDDLLRPIAITEQIHGESARVVERFEYGTSNGNSRNQCGQLIRHDDPATTRHMPDFDLHGLPLLEASHFLESFDPVNWPEEVNARDDLLESGPGLDSRWTYDALGEVATQTDAKLNRRRFSLTCAGQISAVHMQPTGAAAVTLVSDIHYNAGGLVEQERAGNGVITRAEFRPEDARLERLSAGLPGQPLLQDLHYEYDAVGNPLRIEDRSKSVTYFKNQQVDPVSTYTYDSLYRLVAATGREVFHAANDPNALINYSEEYDYDAGGNTLELRHLGTQPFTRRWTVDELSNRSIVLNDGDPPPDFVQAFDGNGNQRHLLRGQTLAWDTRNQLSEVSPVTRDDGEDDIELYRYGGGGKRLRKVRRSLASGRNLIAEVRYLPGLEIHLTPNGEERHVLEVEAGRNSVRLEHWIGSPPVGIDNDYLVYSVSDHLRSSLLELDEQGALISDEGYRPYGERAWWITHQGTKASYKTRGYSGKQRDATGLIYYGFRYYAPWLLRWINPDPAGEVDGLNLFRFVHNSPVRYFDGDGRLTDDESEDDDNFQLLIQDVLDDPDIFRDIESPAHEDAPGTPPSPEPMASSSEPAVSSSAPTAPVPNPVPANPFDPVYLSQMVAHAVATIAPGADLLDPDYLNLMEEPTVAATRVPSSDHQHDARSTPTAISPQPSTSRDANRSFVAQADTRARPTKRAKTGRGRPRKSVTLSRATCDFCDKSFSTTSSLNRHLSKHSGKVFSCSNCDEVFDRPDRLNEHVQRVHMKDFRHRCSFCGKLFFTALHLQNHINTHTGERPFKCAFCPAAFSNAINRQRHFLGHSGVKSFVCTDCNASFTRKANLIKHQKRIHRGA
ncbi:RHS repeat-associated core domain-containing protein [Pseudomonas sp. MYb118]|uniref:RHS repeat-associated core domain-containing protein n=1 Tax=Pseudomonas sp. MYb118 TaxID=1848720 RepID=UPI0034CEC260